jgi:hypothetical protein
LAFLTYRIIIILVTSAETVEIEAKWTTEVYYRGFRILLTQPFENAAAIVGVINTLIQFGFTPTQISESISLPAVEKENIESVNEADPPICPTHNKQMVQRVGPWGPFWSCPTRFPDGSFCKYRPSKKN